MKISICLITLNRYEEFIKNVIPSLERRSGMFDYELLIADNGSTDRRTLEVAHDTFRNSGIPGCWLPFEENIGVAHAFNQMFLRASGDYIATLGNDILMPQDWDLGAMDLFARGNSAELRMGIVGFECAIPMNPVTERNGVMAGWTRPGTEHDRVFGPWVFPAEVFDRIGYLDEGFHPYGLEDSDFMNRLHISGHHSCYHPTLKAPHLGADVGQNTPYRKMKDESLSRGLTYLTEVVVPGYGDARRGVYIPPPKLRMPSGRSFLP